MLYLFRDCLLDTARHELRRAGAVVKLQRKVYQVLAYLVTHADRLVTRDELLEHVWSGVHVADYAVTRSIVAARRAVGDSPEAHAAIQTLHGQGYRFVATVQEKSVAVLPSEPRRTPAPLSQLPLASPSAEEIPPLARGSQAEGVQPAPEQDHSEERKLITVLHGSWSPPAALDLDSLHELLQTVARFVKDTVQPYDGTLQALANGRLEICFGAPVAQEDHTMRAVLAALALQQQWSVLALPLGVPAEHRAPLQCGVHTGMVVVEARGSEAWQRLSIVGEVPAIAATLAQQAPPAAIVVSAASARLLPPEMRLEALPAMPLPTTSASGLVYRVVSHTEQASPQYWLAQEQGSPFVGRQEELALLHTCLSRVRAGQGHVVGIMGEPGIGKTRLLAEFRQSLPWQQVTYVAGRCQSYGGGAPYGPLSQMLRQWWGLTEVDSPAVCRIRVEQELRSLGLDSSVMAPMLLDLLGVSASTEPAAARRPPPRQAQTFAVLHHLFLHSSQGQPLVIEVENVHWADPTTTEYLAALTARLRGAALLLLVTYRPGYAPPWGTSSVATQIALSPLSPQDSLSLVQTALSAQDCDPTIQQSVVTKAGGNPLFLEELTLAVAEQGEAALAPGVPDTIQTVLAARMDRLPAAAKHLLQTAAVISTEVPLPLLHRLAALSEDVLSAQLAHLEASEFFFETRVLPVPIYTFKHVLTQEVAYQSLVRQRRQDVHAQIVHIVVAEFPELATAQPAFLAHHATVADLHAQAVHYWRQAGEQAVERSAPVEAITYLNQGLEVLRKVPEAPERLQHELALQVALGAALLMTRGHAAAEVERTYGRAYALCQHVPATPQLAPVLLGLWRFALVRANLPQARTLGEQLLGLAQRATDPALLVVAHYALGVTLFWCGHLVRALTHLEAGSAHYDPRQHHTLAFQSGQDPGVACLAFAARALWILGYPDQAVQRAQAALQCAQNLAHPFSEAFAQTFMAYVYLRRREWRAAHTHIQAVLALATKHGFPFWQGLGTIQHGWALAAQGQPEAGLGQMEEGMAIWRTTGAGLGEPFFLGLVAQVHSSLHHYPTGLDLLSAALAIVERTGEQWCHADLYRLQGDILLQSGAPAAAVEASWQQALTLANQQQAHSWALRAGLRLGQWWSTQGQGPAAHRLLTELYGRFSEGLTTPDLQEVQALLHTVT